MNKFEFKEKYLETTRANESARIMAKYPDRVPVIVEKIKGDELPDIDKNKFLVPDDLDSHKFQFVIRKRLKIPPEKALFIFVQNQLLPSDLISRIYDKYRDDDGFLYVHYMSQETFG